ncbi:hypothetical protein BDV97DRAFT_287483 [Delphinella strobiligena]|nr:hypothetical protein BDV97DRAFT_287483 [Delphinella strobiligena]
MGLPSSEGAKPQRVLAYMLCQQRKVKCDHKLPCANCIRSQTKCVPATNIAHGQRRRRFPERELLDRLRRYESLLQQNNISFEPLHKETSTIKKSSPNANGDCACARSRDNEKSNLYTGAEQSSSPLVDDSSDSASDDVSEPVLEAWHQLYQNNEPFLFGSRKTTVDLSTLHPQQVQISRLWQIYLDNVNPILKVTHTPTLQGLIIEAAGDMSSIEPTLAALMFSIYCVSIMSLADRECRIMFGSTRESLLARYQSGCQQALLRCEVLRSTNCDCLTALYLYLISIKSTTDPQSLSSMLGIAIRIAQCIGLHTESAYTKCSAFEAEMCQRLWWSLILFDARISELADYKASMLSPTWNCKMPLNVNDFDLQPNMKDSPAVQGNSTEALFAVVCSEMGEFVRHSAFHLDFINPALKIIAKPLQHGPIAEEGELATLEKTTEDKYLKFCNPENPLHFMTIWTARGYLARCRLLEHCSTPSTSPADNTDTRRGSAIPHALSMLECDTKLMTSSLIKGYLWHVHFHFPFVAYIHIVQDLTRRPSGDHTENVWETMSNNYEARFTSLGHDDNPFLKIFTRLIFRAWEAREVELRRLGKLLVPPRIVSDLRQRLARMEQEEQPADMNFDDLLGSMSTDLHGQDLFFGLEGQGYINSGMGGYSNTSGLAAKDADANNLVWNSMDWNAM